MDDAIERDMVEQKVISQLWRLTARLDVKQLRMLFTVVEWLARLVEEWQA